MSYKTVISDLDGTLLKSDHTISTLAKSVFTLLSEMNVNLILASGRPYQDVKSVCDILGIKASTITSNGAMIHDQDGNIVFQSHLPDDLVKTLLNDDVDSDVHVNVYTDNEWLVSKENPELEKYHLLTGFQYRVCDLHSEKINNVCKIFYYGNPEKLKIIEDKLRIHDNELSITFSNENSLEIMNHGISKGDSLKQAHNAINADLNNTIAFGDGQNDYEILSYVKKGFIMKNASDKLKKLLPDTEVVGCNDDDSVANKLISLYSLNL
ncbi:MULTISPECIES: Cof-type HAD-IIB family hydrolase [Vibrio]|uniref:Cof-type HAD-IIB family hydrolase n=1 Tax=Vibrio bivalvicida TaxID=1276888 RepID=A0ABV4MPM6_9VIBR|nr:Cof-type HAD-IIB family hydrolase [Vibrio aestuarianus]MDE1319032.1 Cof-type HAD-IIB family hydrolase [Vibrio aestuarianus]